MSGLLAGVTKAPLDFADQPIVEAISERADKYGCVTASTLDKLPGRETRAKLNAAKELQQAGIVFLSATASDDPELAHKYLVDNPKFARLVGTVSSYLQAYSDTGLDPEFVVKDKRHADELALDAVVATADAISKDIGSAARLFGRNTTEIGTVRKNLEVLKSSEVIRTPALDR